MARPKKKPAKRAAQEKAALEHAEVEHDQSDAASGQKLSTSSPSSEQNSAQRRLSANEDYWRGLIHISGHGPSQGSSKRTKSLHASRKLADVEEQHERYALRSNVCDKRVILLQYPERKSHELYSAQGKNKPVEIRFKPKTGVVEVDIPLNYNQYYSREKGVEFGSAMRRSNMVHRNGAHGLAGGLDAGPPRQSLRSNDALMNDVPPAEALDRFEDAIDEGRALKIFTLGGRVEPFKEGDPIYMIATFSGTACTWTKVDAIVQLRAQLTHLDALNADRKRFSSNLTERSEDKVKEERIEDVNMVVKDTADSETADMYGGMNDTAKLLRSIREEPWQRLQWTDWSTEQSRDVLRENLVQEFPGDAPFLVANLSADQYLDAISCPRVDSVVQGSQISASLRGDAVSSLNTMPAHPVVEDHVDRSESEDFSDDLDITQNELEPGTDLRRTGDTPDAPTERAIEKACRVICSGTERDNKKLERQFSERFGMFPRYSFLRPGHKDNAYFRWRLKQNRIGAGISPQHDYSQPP